MLLYVLAIALFAGNWYFLNKTLKNNWSKILLTCITLVIPIIFHVIGLTYAGAIHSQGAALTSAFLMFVLMFNSIVIVIAIIVYVVRNKKEKE